LKKKALFNWSSGKDSALALYKVLQDPEFEINCLLTSVNQEFQRISMHGVRLALLEQQAKSIGLPLEIMRIPEMPSMEEYESVMQTTLGKLKNQGVTHSIFGDIFLEDLRKYREDKLTTMGFEGVFPLWKVPTHDLIEEFIGLGFKTIVVCVNERFLDKSFVGRIIDQDFIKDLPSLLTDLFSQSPLILRLEKSCIANMKNQKRVPQTPPATPMQQMRLITDFGIVILWKNNGSNKKTPKVRRLRSYCFFLQRLLNHSKADTANL
jgi:uncharacterized protein (TIGR00290 family)